METEKFTAQQPRSRSYVVKDKTLAIARRVGDAGSRFLDTIVNARAHSVIMREDLPTQRRFHREILEQQEVYGRTEQTGTDASK